MELTSTMITATAAALSTAVAFLYKRDAKRSDDDKKKYEADISELKDKATSCEEKHEKSKQQISDLRVKVVKLELQNLMPCNLPECPKRSLTQPIDQDV